METVLQHRQTDCHPALVRLLCRGSHSSVFEHMLVGVCSSKTLVCARVCWVPQNLPEAKNGPRLYLSIVLSFVYAWAWAFSFQRLGIVSGGWCLLRLHGGGGWGLLSLSLCVSAESICWVSRLRRLLQILLKRFLFCLVGVFSIEPCFGP